jgi:serine/threonine-protein phosphatase Stp1
MIADALHSGPIAAHLRPYTFESIALTHPGCVRTLNEDACLDRPDIGLWAVADGMGGHSAGEVASATVVEWLNRVSNFASPFAFRKAVRNALNKANAVLQAKADVEFLDTIGSTVVALLVHRGYYACMWAGDSRAYLWRDHKLQAITRDHSLLQELIDRGAVEASNLLNHPQAHIITRAVGASARLDLDACFGHIEPGDRFLLCSDGLGILSAEAIGNNVGRPSLGDGARGLLSEALARGAPDNVSCVLISCVPAPAI